MIDLHSHTKESDGTLSPEELIWEARSAGVNILAITDHDTFAGYDQALEPARKVNLELICGIELSTKLGHQSVHLLGYFMCCEQLAELRSWVLEMQASRHERNIRLAARLQELGFDITLDEVSARGHGMTGRPHFAQIMVEKGYVRNIQQAFHDYLGESAKAYVHRLEPRFDETVRRIREAGGIASLAHPVRIQGDLPSLLPALCDVGLNAIEAYHSDHGPEHTKLYLSLAKQYGLRVTGGSDFHGETVKPGIKLGTGRNNNLGIPDDLAEHLCPAENHPTVASSSSIRSRTEHLGAGMIVSNHVPNVDGETLSGLGMTVWFTGLSSAGKSTISQAVCEKLRDMRHRVEWLDGDVVRKHLSRGLGFSREDRDENVRRIGFVADLLTRNGVIVLVSAISPYRKTREEMRQRIGNFIEVYVNAPLRICEQRDLKGIYRRARAGEMRGVTGVDDPYEPPLAAEIECLTDRETPSESAARVLSAIQARLDQRKT